MAEMSMNQMIEIHEIRLLRALDDLTGLFEMFVFLHKFGRGNISNFIKDLRMNQQPVYRTLAKLEELGLVTMKMESTPKRESFKSKYYYLTENGQKLAAHIAKMFEVYKKLK